MRSMQATLRAKHPFVNDDIGKLPARGQVPDLAVCGMNREILRQRIQSRLEELGLSPHVAAVNRGYPKDLLRDLLRRPSSSPRYKTLQAAADALQCPISYLTEVEPTPEVIAWREGGPIATPTLTPDVITPDSELTASDRNLAIVRKASAQLHKLMALEGTIATVSSDEFGEGMGRLVQYLSSLPDEKITEESIALIAGREVMAIDYASESETEPDADAENGVKPA